MRFSYSLDGMAFTDVGAKFLAKPGRWIVAKVGVFALASKPATAVGDADYDWFKVE